MACETLKQKIHDTLKAGSFPEPNYFIDVFDDGDEHIRILVISRKFDIHRYTTFRTGGPGLGRYCPSAIRGRTGAYFSYRRYPP